MTPPSPRELPRLLVIGGSVAIVLHLFTFGALVLAAPSGPWPSPFGSSMSPGPTFLQSFNEASNRYYLEPLRMTHNYHFMANRTALPGVYFEVRLKDEKGKTIKTLTFPEENANAWVRHRQTLLAQGLAEDLPVQPGGSERSFGKKKDRPKTTIWEPKTLRLMQVEVHLLNDILNENPNGVFRPSELSLVLAKAYVRFLCRQHGAKSGELVRHTKEPLYPVLAILPEGAQAMPPQEKMVATFGEELK